MKRALAFILAGALAAAACQSTTDTPTLPTTPTPATTENFSGTVNVGGQAVNPFTIALSGGLLTVTLTGVGPTSVPVGLGVGSWDGSTCTLLSNGSVTATAGSTPQLSGNVNGGQYCVTIFDVGNLTAPATYAVTVTHY
jgi:hypothetical protein